MPRIDLHAYQRSLDHLTQILSDIVQHADEMAKGRCPYKDRFNQCTAAFGCRNKRKAETPGGKPRCAGDDKLNYRGAWETS